MRTEIEKKKGAIVPFTWQEREKKKKTIIVDNQTTIRRHVPHHIKENMVANPQRQQNIRFGHRVASHVTPE